MISILNFILRVIYYIVSIFVVVFMSFGLYEHIMGPEDAKALLKKYNIPLSYKGVLLVGFCSIAFFIVLGIILQKWK